MSASDDDDDRGISLGQTFRVDPTNEVTHVLDELEDLLKNGDVITALSNKGVNASLALVAIEGLRAYLEGRKEDAAEDLSTVAEEIRGRLELSRTSYKETN